VLPAGRPAGRRPGARCAARDGPRSQRAAPPTPLAQLFDALSDWLAPIARPATARPEATAVPAATRAVRLPGAARAPQAAPPAAKPQRGSRLFRAHALGRFGS
jgi:hypothetical protein